MTVYVSRVQRRAARLILARGRRPVSDAVRKIAAAR